MSYFVCIGLSKSDVDLSKNHDELIFREATNSPIGQRLSANGKYIPFFVLSDGSSEEILGKGRKRKSRVAQFHHLLNELQERRSYFNLLVHIFRGDVTTEEVEVKSKTKISIAKIVHAFPEIDLDVLYSVIPAEKAATDTANRDTPIPF
ncbi:MAG: hypothetical protein NXI24_22155 [bacterium]|nr:hypothetical protein [bacterium]